MASEEPQDDLEQGDPQDASPLTPGDDVSQPVSSTAKNLYLFQEEVDSERPFTSHFIRNFMNLHSIIPTSRAAEESTAQPQTKKLNTILGVFLPCVQNIFGIILFIRLTWIIGNAGLIEGSIIVFMCCCATFLTSISISAIATNGVMKGGGPYFLISRSLGPEFGAAVGCLFYLANTVASAMYVIGAVEVLLKYMAPGMSIFGDVTVEANAFNNFRVYGSILLLILFVCVFIGVRFVSIVAAISLSCVLLSIVSIYAGIIKSAFAPPDLKICMLGERLLTEKSISLHGQVFCDKSQFCNVEENVTEPCPLYLRYCHLQNDTGEFECDPYFTENEVRYFNGIPGLKNSPASRNVWSHYRRRGDGAPGVPGDRGRGDVISDFTTSFLILVGIYFPSVTGILAGCNRSGDLRDPSNSIPKGTIAAQTMTSCIYLGCAMLFGCCVEGPLMRDKFGESVGGKLIVSQLAWPHEWVILIGCFLSSLGAGLQSLTSAPRLLQSIAKDEVVPFLRPFAVTTKRGEPARALFLTVAISWSAILIASIDYIAPLLTMFFLMCYGNINFACALQTLLREPSWRPRFRYYHWIMSLFGFGLCIALMFISSWYFAILAIVIAIVIYKYVEYKGAEKEYGDGIQGLSMSAARFALLRLEDAPPHTKNWRPQLLVFVDLQQDYSPRSDKLVSLASQLKHGRGLTLVASVIEGDFTELSAEAAAAKQGLKKLVQQNRVKGFAEVVVAKVAADGVFHLIQTAGLGGMRPNTVLTNWPIGWRQDQREKPAWKLFAATVRAAQAAKVAALVAKGTDFFPANDDRISGTVDVWWIVHDGGLLMLLPFLLKQHKVWSKCKLRIFTVAQLEDNSVQMKEDLKQFVYQLRIKADVDVIEMPDNDISAYTYERTMLMEQRHQMIRDLKLTKSEQETQAMLQKQRDAGAQPSGQLTTQYTFSPRELKKSALDEDPSTSPRPDQANVRKMHTAVRLNEVIVQRSHDARLVIINLPGPPNSEGAEANWMEFLEVLTEGLEKVLMVRGTGKEVITIFS